MSRRLSVVICESALMGCSGMCAFFGHGAIPLNGKAELGEAQISFYRLAEIGISP